MDHTLNNVLLHAANQAMAWQRADGSFPPGHNGPWGSVDTPVRCTAHWSILLAHAHRLTGLANLREAARRAADYLASPEARPKHAAFHCCVSHNPFGNANGLIGQAWAIEAILEAGADYLPLALEVARLHQFDDQLGLWHMLGIGGEVGSPHRTLNQQLWFSAMIFRLARLVDDAPLLARARRFFARLPEMIRMDGPCIDMLIRERYLFGDAWRPYLWQQARKLRHFVHEFREIRYVHEQTLGYLGFTLYGLAVLHQEAPDLPLWQDARWRNALASSVAYADQHLLSLPLTHNRYGFSYNPLGIEMALTKQSFGNLARGSRSAAEWLDRQWRDHLDPDTGLMTRNTGDPNILAARIYQACRLNEIK